MRASATRKRSASSPTPTAVSCRCTLPDRRFPSGRRGPAPGDAARRLARPRAVRGPRIAARLAVPDRHQPLAGCPAGEPAPPEDPQRMTATPEPTRYGDAIWLEPFPDVLLEGIPDQAPGPEARYEAGRRSRWRSSSACSISRRSSARCSCCATCSGSAPARPPRAGHHRASGQQPRAARAGGTRRRLPANPRERAPLPHSKLERDIVGRFADAIQTGDTDASSPCSPTTPG